MEYINLKKHIAESDSKSLKRLPGFIISLLEKVIRQKSVNQLLTSCDGHEGIAFLPRALDELNIKVDIEGIENLPDNGKCFFVANHPYGFVDGLILTSIVAKKYGDYRAIGNENFLLVPHIRPNIAAVNVFGTNPRTYLMELEKIYRSDMPITHFPAGLVSRLKKGKVRDSDWQKSFIAKSSSCQRNIVPFHFTGRNSCVFYFIFLFRKAFRIKANLELSLLPHEIFTKRNKTIKVKIGKPLSYEMFDKSRSHLEWAQEVKDHIYTI